MSKFPTKLEPEACVTTIKSFCFLVVGSCFFVDASSLVRSHELVSNAKIIHLLMLKMYLLNLLETARFVIGESRRRMRVKKVIKKLLLFFLFVYYELLVIIFNLLHFSCFTDINSYIIFYDVIKTYYIFIIILIIAL